MRSVCLREGVDLDAQLPYELGAVVDGDAIPKERVRVGLLFLAAGPEDLNMRVRARDAASLRVVIVSAGHR